MSSINESTEEGRNKEVGASEIIIKSEYEQTLYEAISDKRAYRAAFLIVIIFLGVSTSLNLLQFNYIPASKVVAQTADGRITPLPTLDEPIYTASNVLAWAAEKGEALYDLPFTELTVYPNRLAQFMTPDAKNQFIEGMTSSGITPLVKKERLILRGVRSAPPALVEEYLRNGRYVWVVDMPVSRVFEAEKGRRQDEVVLRMYVGRASLMEYEKNGLVLGSVSVFGSNEVIR